MARDRQTIAQSQQADSSRGLAVDAQGGPVFDPSKNVLDLVEAAIKRQDDLREAHEKMVNSEIAHVKEMAAVSRAYEEKLVVQEARRIDAIRQVDVTATATAADRASAAIETLAKQTSSDRETLRAAVTASASTLASQNSETVSQLVGRITALELALSKSTGKEAVSDPMMVQMVNEIKALRNDAQISTGKGIAIEKVIGLIAASGGGAGLIGFFISRMAQ